jgi:predicted PurR-regulated permease PerM
MRDHRVDISYKTILFIAGFIALVWALYTIIDVIVILFVAIIFMAGLYPIVSYLESLRIPKALAIAVTYIIILGMLGTLLYLVINPLIEQTTNLILHLPQTITSLFPEGGPVDPSIIQDQLGNVSRNALNFTLTIFNNVIAFISVAVLTFYLLLEREKLDHLISQFFVGEEERIKRIIDKIEDKLGAWLRGQIALSLIIGTMAYVVLFLLGVPYALPLAILAGIFEVVPVIGPIISSIPAILVAFTISPFLGLLTAVAFFVIQQLENNLIVPQVMKRAVGLNPLIVILAVSIGGKLLGIPGALLAVPISVVIQIITEDILREEKS